MQTEITLSQHDLRAIVADYLSERLGRDIPSEKIVIETKSTQNYKSEWENADFRARFYEVEVK